MTQCIVIYNHLLVRYVRKSQDTKSTVVWQMFRHRPREPIQDSGLNKDFIQKVLQCLRFYVFFF